MKALGLMRLQTKNFSTVSVFVEEIFQKTFKYLGMDYRGTLFYYSGDDQALSVQNQDKIISFSELLYA